MSGQKDGYPRARLDGDASIYHGRIAVGFCAGKKGFGSIIVSHCITAVVGNTFIHYHVDLVFSIYRSKILAR